MEVRPGYKQTEVGVIPEEWDSARLDSLGDGKRPPIKAGPFGSTLTKDQYVPVGFKVYGQEQVIAGDPFFGDYFISSTKYRELESCAVQPGDILLSLVGTIGRLLEIPDGAPLGVINPRLLRFSLDRKRVSPRFLKYVFESGTVQSRLERQAQGGTMGVLNAGVLRPFHIPLPRLPEQRAIATALSDVDVLLGGLERLIVKKRDFKQAAMQQLLTGQTRLPGFHGQWEVKRIREFTACVAGGTPSTFVPPYWGGSIKWMSSGELHLKRVEDVAARITEDGLRNSAATMLPKKCVLVGLAGQGRTRGTVAITMAELSTNQSIAAVLPSPAFVPEYLYHNLDRRYNELRDLSSGGGGRGGLNLKLIGSIPIPLPCIAEQTAIAAVLDDMDAELATLEARRDKTRDLKLAMMQELLSGKTRLVPAGGADA